MGVPSAAYAAAWEPYHPRVERVDIAIKNLPPAFDGFRIVQLSDLHIQPAFPASRLAPALTLVKNEKPDLMVLTGDYVWDQADHPGNYMKACAEACRSLTDWARHGVFAIFGNHDYPEPPDEPPVHFWHDAGIQTLQDAVVPLTQNGDTIYLAGLRSFIARPVSPADVLAQTPDDSVRIVLWHEPDRAEECARLGASLQLSGHTHGGQIRLPFVGPPLLPHGGRLYPMGLYEVAGMPLYVTRGVGMLMPWMRFCCPPEVTVLTLRQRRKQAQKR